MYGSTKNIGFPGCHLSSFMFGWEWAVLAGALQRGKHFWHIISCEIPYSRVATEVERWEPIELHSQIELFSGLVRHYIQNNIIYQIHLLCVFSARSTSERTFWEDIRLFLKTIWLRWVQHFAVVVWCPLLPAGLLRATVRRMRICHSWTHCLSHVIDSFHQFCIFCF